ncbi:beta-class carbonic anhydrase [Actinomadura sp. HBU206391]|uniref:beta-class carbonic anhydrase n=1 Tax=Actinomadura sp. HBU206391 TaxID=2731692 RepID=UPI00164F15F8|nr:carbonic anhydrase [Actinomadura sp. HBU206391]MBC6463279.1 carbonic anhydrase [Actinomadura sp. HBU206391]
MSQTDLLVARQALRRPLVTLPQRPSSQIAILSCMDARLNVFAIFGLAEGDAHVIRNAGGCVTGDAIRSIALSQQVGGTREVVLLHHEDCAAVPDPETDLRRCLGRLRSTFLLPHTDAIRGFLYEAGGVLRETHPEE